MIRLVIPMVAFIICGWILWLGLPEKWRGKVWNESLHWLQLASVVCGMLIVFSVAFGILKDIS